MKRGWLYIVELAPTGYIKIGRSETPTRRISDHISNAAFGGASVTKFASFAVDDAQEEEQRVLHHLRWTPGVALAHGQETFSGLSFAEALMHMEQLINAPVAPPMKMDEFLVRAAEVMDECGVTRVLLGELRELLGSRGPSTNRELGDLLARNGVPRGTVWSRRLKRDGYGVRREDLPVAKVTALSKSTAPDEEQAG